MSLTKLALSTVLAAIALLSFGTSALAQPHHYHHHHHVRHHHHHHPH